MRVRRYVQEAAVSGRDVTFTLELQSARRVVSSLRAMACRSCGTLVTKVHGTPLVMQAFGAAPQGALVRQP